MDAGSGGGAGKSMPKGEEAAAKHQQEIYENPGCHFHQNHT